MKKKFHLIANAHLDPVWQWRVPEGLSLVKSTFRSALDRMNEFPDYTFTSACASYYKWIKLYEPEMFEEIKQRVKKADGQLLAVCGCNPIATFRRVRHSAVTCSIHKSFSKRISDSS